MSRRAPRRSGVQRQYSGTAGRIENCQIAVYLALATPGGHAAVDVRLYLPKVWTDDADRRRVAEVPDEVGIRTKPELAAAMIEAALDAGIGADSATGDEAYGINHGLRHRIRARGGCPIPGRCLHHARHARIGEGDRCRWVHSFSDVAFECSPRSGALDG